jgi:hypothetical protein
MSARTACPECRAGKHPNCDGTTWDTVRDEPAACPCAAAGHGTGQLDDLFTATDAADAHGLSPATVRSWRKRGHLTEAGRNERGARLYRGIDLLRAEAATREHARRKA